MIKMSLKFSTALCFMALLSGCGTSHKLKHAEFTAAYTQADYCKAAGIVLEEDKVCEQNVEDVADYDVNIDEKLNGATSLFLADHHDTSNVLFEQAASTIQEGLSSSGVVRGTVEVLANASVMDYDPMIMDSIYLQSYAIFNALSQNNKDEAKIQINRAYGTQQAAVEAFKKDIEEQKEKTSKEVSEWQKEAKAANDENISTVLSNYKEFERWKGYSDFVNPYVTYLSGLYLMTNGADNNDFETASNYMKRVRGMAPENSFVKDDLNLADKLASGNKDALKPTAWIIFENGLVANFEEFRIDLPIFIATNNVKTASLALPYPKLREEAYPNISVSNGKKSVTTQLLTDVDSIFIAEFKNKLPMIVTKAVTKLAVQTTAQYFAQQKFGDLGGIGMAAYSIMTAGADTRSWYSLPKNVQSAKINKNGTTLKLNIGGQSYDVETAQDGFSIVYVRVPANGAQPVIDVFNL